MTTTETGAPPAVSVPPRADRRLLRRLLWGLLVVAFLATCVQRGLPTDRLTLLAWVVAALAVHCVGRGRRSLLRMLVDWLPLAAVLLAYDWTRGLADTLGMQVHVTEPVVADRWLTGGTLPTVWLQEHWQASWWEAVATLVYSSHFVVTPVVLGVLWLRDRARWGRYVRLVVALSAAGLVTYVLYPAAPPWLAAKADVIEPVERISGAGWAVLGLPRAGALLTTGQGQVNPVAAIPSLHTAFAVLTCLALLPLARRVWQRAGLVAYAVLMPLVLVWSGEHYVVDTLLGALYAAAVCTLVPLAGRVWQRRRSPAPVPAAPVPRVGASVTATTSSG